MTEKCPVLNKICEHYSYQCDRNGKVAINHCKHSDNVSEFEGNCTSALCPLVEFRKPPVDVSKLEGADLDLTVAKVVQKNKPEAYSDHHIYVKEGKCFIEEPPGIDEPYHYSPSTNGSQGMAIIKEHCINIRHIGKVTTPDENVDPNFHWMATVDGKFFTYGSAPLIAAMRAFVASKNT